MTNAWTYFAGWSCAIGDLECTLKSLVVLFIPYLFVTSLIYLLAFYILSLRKLVSNPLLRRVMHAIGIILIIGPIIFALGYLVNIPIEDKKQLQQLEESNNQAFYDAQFPVYRPSYIPDGYKIVYASYSEYDFFFNLGHEEKNEYISVVMIPVVSIPEAINPCAWPRINNHTCEIYSADASLGIHVSTDLSSTVYYMTLDRTRIRVDVGHATVSKQEVIKMMTSLEKVNQERANS